MNNGVVTPLQKDGLKSIHVLIADPDETLLGDYRDQSRDGFHVATASNGLECINRLRERAPDVFVLEPQLLWGGGDGVLAMMHDVLDLATVPVMLLTSCSDPLILDNVARFPISDFHPKPLSPALLVRRVHRLLYDQTLQSNFEEQNRRLECLISRQTGGRIQGLRVEATDTRIIVHGRSRTHHARQLVLGVLMDEFETSEFETKNVEVEIHVYGNL